MHPLSTSRRFYELELLECRYFLSIVPIDATAGVPFEGIVATNLRLPAHATGLHLLNVMINGQWDYQPTAIPREDGTFDLHTRMTPQRAGTEEMTIWFRNDITGGWDILERGDQTVRPNHFSASVPDASVYNRVPGTLMRDVLVTFTTTPLTRSLDEYVVDVHWFGKAKSGRLVRQGDGSVAAYVNDAYFPPGRDGNGDSDGEVNVTIRLADAPADAPVAGFARASVSAGFGIGIGMFYGQMTSDTGFRIAMPKKQPYEGVPYHYFIPASVSDGWPATFTVEVIWQFHDDTVATSSASVVRNADGTHWVVGDVPAGVTFDNGMIKIRETVQRPALDGAPAQSYLVEYVGSFNIIEGALPEIDLPMKGEVDIEKPADPEPTMPEGGGGGSGSIDEPNFGALADSRGFDSIVKSLFSDSDDDSLVGDIANEVADNTSLPA